MQKGHEMHKRSQEQYRTLSGDFVEFLDKRHPRYLTDDQVNAAFQALGPKGMRTGTYNAWKAGDPVEQGYHLRIIELFLATDDELKALDKAFENEKVPTIRKMQGIVFEFLQSRGEKIDPRPSPERVLELICDPPALPDGHDFIADGLAVTPRLLEWKGLFTCCKPCPKEKIPAAVRWIFVWVGRELQADSTVQEAIGLAESHWCVTLRDYQRFAVAWAEICPWAVTMCRGDVGISIVLPINQATYEAVRSGKLRSSTISASSLKMPPDHFLIESLCVRPKDVGGPTVNETLTLAGTILYQFAQLADFGSIIRESNGKARTMQSISYAITDRVRHRLIKHGYASTHTFMKDSGHELFERQCLPKSHKTRLYIGLWSIINMLSVLPRTFKDALDQEESSSA